MEEFEYKIYYFWAETLIKDLNEVGKMGWELVSAIRCIGVDSNDEQKLQYECIFKRNICFTDTQL